ncbi:MAG: class A beta-lactamase-related serine hydrolase [Proteobacteria bacterium]|nr:class A beta-lactamase-related serine hydrolase [Pseudomonadota bacterium]
MPNLATIEMIDSASSDIEKEKVFPLGSISKSFCGATAALIAVAGKFGTNRLNATIEETLQLATENYPQRREQISELRQIAAKLEILDAKLVELLNHSSGLSDGLEDWSGNPPYHPIKDAANYQNKSALQIADEKFALHRDKKGRHNYSNANFVLLEEIIGLCSESGSYKQELQTRVLDKCKMLSSGDLYDFPDALENQVGKFVGADENGNLITVNIAYRAPGAQAKVALAQGGIAAS